MNAIPICNSCLRSFGFKPVDSYCTEPTCGHHHECAFCGKTTDGRFIVNTTPRASNGDTR